MSSISVGALKELYAIDFRAPPPSPVAAGRRSTVENDDVLSEFLEHSLRVPDLLLPDRVFPRQKNVEKPPILDLESNGRESIFESIGRIGCFEIRNHGIPMDMIRSVIEFSGGLFEISAEKKAIVSRSSGRPYGFVDFFEKEEEEEREVSEEFIWCREEAMKLEMEGVWPLHYSNFSCKVEKLLSEIEKVGAKVIQAMENKLKRKWAYDDVHGIRRKEQELEGSICYFYKHCRSLSKDDHHHDQLKYDVVRMLIMGSEHSHALCFHICDGSSDFHVYSKKSWVSFCPDNSALVVTIGDQLQAWSGGQYKHVIGRPMFNIEDEDHNISMAFVYSPPTKETVNTFAKGGAQERNITIGQQVFFALLISLFCHFFI